MKDKVKRLVRFTARQVNAAFPFLYASRTMAKRCNFIRGPIAYVRDYRQYRAMNTSDDFPLRLLDLFPFFYDRYEESGVLPRHYFHLDLWAARKVYESRVPLHYDFASRVDGFVAHCLVFCKVRLFDIRPLSQNIEGLEFVQADVTDLRSVASGSITSLSSLHAIEHIGLGRYGDPIDPNGYLYALKEFERVLAQGASLYLGAPIGRQRLEFNGHRIFGPRHFIDVLQGCRLEEFSAVDDENRFMRNANSNDFAEEDYACGMYHFRRL